MSYKRKYNSETGLQEVVEGTQTEGVSIEAANQHNYKSQIDALEAEKSFDKTEAEARGLEYDSTAIDAKLLKLEKAYNATLEFGGIETSASRDFTGKAKGGWINGPMSGYPVSLDGGRSTAFIGHGLEWVGSKMASGGAFVVPYNTPATKKDSGLTSRRFREAMQGGYALPTKAEGGEVEQVIGNVEVENKIMGQGFNIDIEELRKHQAQILRQLPEGTSIDDVIAGEVDMQHTQLIKILANSDAQRATHQRRRMEVVSKLKNNFANFLRAEPNEEGQATGWKRIYMGLADAYTGNKYDFDGRGDMLDGAEKLHTEVGNMIELAKLALVDKKNEILAQQNKVVEAPKVTADPIVTGSGGGGSFDVPISVDNDGAADPYLITRFGLVSEFNGDMADLM